MGWVFKFTRREGLVGHTMNNLFVKFEDLENVWKNTFYWIFEFQLFGHDKIWSIDLLPRHGTSQTFFITCYVIIHRTKNLHSNFRNNDFELLLSDKILSTLFNCLLTLRYAVVKLKYRNWLQLEESENSTYVCTHVNWAKTIK